MRPTIVIEDRDHIPSTPLWRNLDYMLLWSGQSACLILHDWADLCHWKCRRYRWRSGCNFYSEKI